MEQDIEFLKKELAVFAKERSWEQFHHPKDLALCLSAEIAELMEHFVWESHENSTSLMKGPNGVEIEHEIGDVFTCILLLCKALKIDLRDITSERQPIPPASTPKHLISQLVVRTGRLAEHFLWISEEEHKIRPPSKELLASFSSVLSAFLSLVEMLQVNPIEASLKKLVVLREKYPAHLVKGSVDKYLARKKSLKNA